MKSKILALVMLLNISLITFAQDAIVSTGGKVVDRWGSPVSGALITVNNSSVQTATDIKGEFSLQFQTGDKLTVESYDFSRKTVEVGDVKNPLNIVLDYTSQAVDLGFGIKRTVEESTASISRTNAKQVDVRSAFNLSNSLFGNALGLSAMQNPGTIWENAASFSIRGLQTLSSNGVLILVDGFERPINELTPEEVESVSVLRDAAAVALYGYRGVNGIVSVKTKRGKYNTKEINVSYDHAFNSPIRLPEFADSYTYANAINEALVNDRKPARYSQNQLDAFKSGAYPYLYPNVDWVNETLRDRGHSNIYKVNFRGGGTKMRYYTALILQNNSGYINNAEVNEDYSAQLKYSQANVRSNLDIDMSPTSKLEVNLLGILNEHNRPGRHQSQIMQDLYTLPSAAYPIKTYDGIWGGNETWPTTNPVAGALGTGFSRGHSRSFFADAKLSQGLDFVTKGLSAYVRLGYDNQAAYWENRNNQYQYANDVVSMKTGVPRDTVRTIGGKVEKRGFDSSLGAQTRHFNAEASLGYEYAKDRNSLQASLIYSYDNQVTSGQHNTFFRQNFAAYTHYAFDKKYIADLILMLSGSNRLATDHKYAFSPTFSLGWVLSNEDFMKDVKYIDFLKFRASAGIVHTDYIPTVNFWNQSFGGGAGYYLGSNYDFSSGTQEGRLPSLNIKQERAIKYNLGLDASLLKSFVFTGDVYYERRDNIFVSSAGETSAVLGALVPYANAGIVDSYGVELGLNYDKKVGDFTLMAGTKFTLSKNEIKEQLEEPQAYDYLKRTGKPLHQIFGYQALGFFVDDEDIKHSPVQQFSDVKPGDIKYKDQNGDNIINELDQVAMGYNTAIPEIYYSFDLGVEWKGLGLTASFQGVGNYSAMLNTQSMYWPLINNTTISNHYYNNRWTPETPFAMYPRLTTESNANNFTNNTVWLTDASFLKMRNVELYYNFAQPLLSKIKMKSARLYLRGVDLLCFDNIDISDPESIGVAYPMTKSVHIGFALGF